jgi:uncharacterized membrane protein YgcG
MRTHFIVAAALLLIACGAPQNQESAKVQTKSVQPPDSLDELLAPVALYPDALLAQILQCAQDPPKVTELDQWLKANSNMKGTELQDAALKAGFEPSFITMVVFPAVVTKMAAQIPWVTLLGQAFTANRTQVFDAIQRLRKQAQGVGTLKTTAQQEVETKTTSSGDSVIVIEPANPQVVYVPQYDPQVVYTQPPTSTTVVVQEDNTDQAVAAGMIGFTAGIVMGSMMNNNNYYYGSPYGFYGGAYMYNEAWEDYYDYREDAREDWMDHREDVMENRSDVARDRQEQRTERTETRAENRPDGTAPRTGQRAQSAAATTNATTRTTGANRQGSPSSRGYGGNQAVQQRASSDAFSGYSSGSSQRASSARGQSSRSGGSRSGGGGRRR